MLTVNLLDHTVSRDGEQIPLTPSEFRVVAVLCLNPHLLSKGQISDLAGLECWDDVVRWHVMNIRKKGIQIRTRKYYGYALDEDSSVVRAPELQAI